MLENVAVGQSRFITPGVSPDPRGVVLGRYGLLFFPTLEGVVSWLRLYTAEASLDEVLPALAIHRLVTPLKSREIAVRIPATSSYAMDRAARCARLIGGRLYTGTSKHFVQYRDDRSPYGYDATEISTLPEGAEVMVHAREFRQTYKKDGEIDFAKLLFRLSLRKVPGAEDLADDERKELILVVARGLGDGVVRYLWRNRIEASVADVRPRGDSIFEDSRAQGYLVFRVSNLPERMLELFLATPGIDVLSPVAGNAATEVGYRHPIELSACASIFEEGAFYLFWGRDDRVDVLDAPLELSDIADVTRIDLDLEKASTTSSLAVEAKASLGVEIQLAPSQSSSRGVSGTLVAPDRAVWLKRLVYLLPHSVLRGHRVVVTDRGILLVASREIELIPLGQPLVELASGLYVPLGMDLVPRVSPSVLAHALGHAAGVLTVFPSAGRPFQVEETALVPLERASVASLDVDPVETRDVGVEPTGQPTIVNEATGGFALWGFPRPRDSSRLLPAADDGDES